MSNYMLKTTIKVLKWESYSYTCLKEADNLSNSLITKNLKSVSGFVRHIHYWNYLPKTCTYKIIIHQKKIILFFSSITNCIWRRVAFVLRTGTSQLIPTCRIWHTTNSSDIADRSIYLQYSIDGVTWAWLATLPQQDFIEVFTLFFL